LGFGHVEVVAVDSGSALEGPAVATLVVEITVAVVQPPWRPGCIVAREEGVDPIGPTASIEGL
jgi:hypothetical protein